MIQAYEFAIEKIGHDHASFPVCFQFLYLFLFIYDYII